MPQPQSRQFHLADLYELVAEAVPDRTALVAGPERRTFAELDERANRAASHLASLGLEKQSKVAVLAWNRAEWMEVFLGAFKAGMVPININYRYTPSELRYVLADSDSVVLVHERGFAGAVSEILPDLPLVTHRIVLEDGREGDTGDAALYEEALAEAPASPPGVDRSPDDLFILYTGGTTGMPKGVMWRHHDVFLAGLRGGVAFGGDPLEVPEDIVDRIAPTETLPIGMAIAPLMHGAALWGSLIMIMSGGTAVLYTDRGFDPHAVWALVERERCTTVMVVGDAMARPLAEALAEPTAGYDVSSVFSFGSGGAVFSPSVQEQLQQLLPNAFVMDTFGSSEMGSSGSSAGKPRLFAPTSDTSVLDEESYRELDPGTGQVGLLARRGPIPLGYYKDQEKTARTFVTDPEGVRWVIPGDYATREADGTITLLGRGSQTINSGGEKVYPEEVEAALKSHPDVYDALVVGAPDERFGERVAAVVQPREGARPTLETLDVHCRRTIAGYKVPREVRLVEEIKRSPAGKADYPWAQALFASNDPQT